MSLQQFYGFEPVKWIDERIDPLPPKDTDTVWRGVPVSRLLPRGFDSYIQVLQPIWRQFADSIVTDLLMPFTHHQCCWIYHPLTSRLYSGNLFEVVAGLPREFPESEYWWPEDHSWCVNTDWDLDFTLVGGCSELIRCFIENRDLFAVALSLSTRIDQFANARDAQKQIRQVAEAVLSGLMSLSMAAKEAYRFRYYLGKEFEAVLQPLLAIECKTRYLPVGPVRDLWAPEALVSKDAEVLSIENDYRSKAIRCCQEILARLNSGEMHRE